MDNKLIGVIGAGTMGHGIAQVFAQAHYPVTLVDINDEALNLALIHIESSLERQVKKGNVSSEQKAACLDHIKLSTELEDLSAASLVIEAVTENFSTKQKIFESLDFVCQPKTILATNTSSISITKLASTTRRPGQVIGMHFMNPVPLMTLVEVIRGRKTSDEVFNQILAYTKVLNKTPVTSADYPGFIANRILMPMINEAIFALHEGVGTVEGIDGVMKLGMNHPMGPLALADLIGLDTCLNIMDVLNDGFRDSKYRPCPLLKQMVDAGQLGRKSGEGFYRYS